MGGHQVSASRRDEDEQRWICDAQIAEITYIAFEGTRWAITPGWSCAASSASTRTSTPGQGELFARYRYHAVFTDSPFVMHQAEARHRGHAVIEQVNADLIEGPLKYLPAGRFATEARARLPL